MSSFLLAELALFQSLTEATECITRQLFRKQPLQADSVSEEVLHHYADKAVSLAERVFTCRALGRTGPDESVQPIRSFVLDGYPVSKLQFWQNPNITGQVAILTAHGCWHVDLTKEGTEEGKPCKSP